MPHKKYVHRQTAIKDIKIIVILNVIFLFAFMQMDILEWLYQLSREHEEFELDEWLPLSITIALSLLVFSYRRIIELGSMAQTFEEISLLDLLSGLANRRAGQISLASWCEAAESKQQPFVIYRVNINDFTDVNRLYGSDIGDEVIKDVAHRIKKLTPKNGEVYRWLDDNFVIILPLTNVETSKRFSSQLKQAINNQIMPSVLSLTCFVAYIVWEPEQTSNDVLFELENAMFKEKGGIGQSS